MFLKLNHWYHEENAERLLVAREGDKTKSLEGDAGVLIPVL